MAEPTAPSSSPTARLSRWDSKPHLLIDSLSLPWRVILATRAVSRKTHGSAGTFDVNLPLSGEPGVECRNSVGNQALVFTFSSNVVSGSASVTGGTGSVFGNHIFSGNTMPVKLKGVTDVRKFTVTLRDVT